VLHEVGTPLTIRVFRIGSRFAVRRGAEHGMHESQSRLWRTMWAEVLRSGDIASVLRSLFPDEMEGLEAKVPSRRQCVRPGAIRVDADEMSYHLHICFDMS